MKLIFFTILVAVMISVSVSLEKKKPKPCLKDCGTEYTPICAKSKTGNDPAKSFGSICVMDNYNCENNAHLEKISDKECPGGGGVRLS